ncbi:NUDIX domain-containing protein [Actinopolymorpha sp. B17G11]|uniref:NUDIX hydrolase n=1 Tax=Actinopolymorpha sp. B17G11 TaxID=3160861 RepID=UPI0032E3EC83
MSEPTASKTAARSRSWTGVRAYIERATSRVLPVDTAGRMLLLYGFDPVRPEEPFWFTVGGAIDRGETPREAARRELREETGIVVDASVFGEPLASYMVEFSWGGYFVVQSQAFFAVRVGEVAVSFDGLDALERATTVSYRWWYADELAASGERYPDGLPALIRRAARA